MTDRASFDTPATVTAVVLGVVLIGVSTPFTVKHWADERSEWVPAWSETPLAASSATLSGGGGDASAELEVEDVLLASLAVTFPSCADSAQAPVQAQATIAWTLRDAAGAELASDALTCAEAAGYEYVVERTPVPDLGDLSAPDAEAAARKAWAEASEGNETATFMLDVSWSHPSPVPGLPLPLPGANLDGEARLTPRAWTLEVREPSDGVVR